MDFIYVADGMPVGPVHLVVSASGAQLEGNFIQACQAIVHYRCNFSGIEAVFAGLKLAELLANA